MSDDLRKTILMSGSLPPPSGLSASLPPGRNGPLRGHRDYSPVGWDEYFERIHDVAIDKDIFRVYERGDSGPVCFFLHGGGFSGLSWAVLSKSLSHLVTCRCAAMDSRGHGDTVTSQDDILSTQVQVSDVGRVIKQLYGEDPPPIILIGHSMGGAIAVHAAMNNVVPSIVALIVIDVVEGTALDALSGMQTFLRSRPSTFKSMEHAIEYCVRSGQIKNLASARVSVAGQVKRLDDNSDTGPGSCPSSVSCPGQDTLTEEEETPSEPTKASSQQSNKSSPKEQSAQASSTGSYSWRVDLSKTDIYWKGWFEGLSRNFLSCSVPKMLLLAGVDRLDKELTVGQMQGKFQMKVLPQCGHAVHEDCPEKVADALATFLVRHKLVPATDNFQRAFPV